MNTPKDFWGYEVHKATDTVNLRVKEDHILLSTSSEWSEPQCLRFTREEAKRLAKLLNEVV